MPEETIGSNKVDPEDWNFYQRRQLKAQKIKV